MKRLLAFLAALMLFTGSITALGEGGINVYTSDFGTGNDGWYARSMGAAKISASHDGTLSITGRSDNWHSPGRDFPLICGGKYEISVSVRQNQADSAGFMISVAHTKNGGETYENIARATVKKDEWTTLSGTYIAGDYEKFVLYVETTNAPELDFEIRDFNVNAPGGEPEPKPTPEPMIIEPAEDIPALKEVYARRFDFGSCIPLSMLSDPKAMEFVRGQFNIVTHENELKPESVLDMNTCRKMAEEDETAVAFNFSKAKPLLDFAKENGIKVHGHVLVWHSQTPEAFFHEGYDVHRPMVSREVMLGRMENYISGVFAYMTENYPGVVVSWDVVNEAVDDTTGRLRKSPWLDSVGTDYLVRAFEIARKHAPEGTLLFYNDYNTANSVKLKGITELLGSLMEGGCIDGYGFQMHHSLASPSMDEIRTAVKTIAGLGIRLRVSEMDITVGDNGKESFMAQAEKYAEIMLLLDEYSSQFDAVQVWGVTDALSWRGTQYPLLFDGSYNPKPAFFAVAAPENYTE